MILVDRHLRLLKRVLFLVFIYSVLRIGFYFYHLNIYKQFTQEMIFESFWLGVRFDVAAILILNLPILFLSFFKFKSRLSQSLERSLFIFLNFLGISIGLNDYELFSFIGKRLSFDFFAINSDIIDQIPQLLSNFWYFPLIAILFTLVFYQLDKKLFSLSKPANYSIARILISSFLVLFLTAIGIRGGVQRKSINVQTAFTQGQNLLGHLVLNTPYHFLRTLKNKPQKQLSFFNKDSDAINVIINRRDFRDQFIQDKKLNVVLFVMESFSLEYMEQGYMPFLTSLKEKSLFFPYHLANGRRSIEALPSLLCGLPSLLNDPVSKSIYQGNKFVCLPQLLKEQGYTNYFFHGANRGSMGFESYTLSNGFDKYFSREEFPYPNEYDGTWGIFDEPFFKVAAEEISKMPRPFFAGVFSLSSHQPYKVPEKYQGKFKKGTLEIHQSIGYADFALQEFFKQIEKESWFKDTVFIITADHTSKLETKKFQNEIGHYRVPLLVYSPGVKLPAVNTQKVTQHSDIPKSVLHLMNVKNDDFPATSVSFFGRDHGYAFYYADGQSYAMASVEGLTTFNGEGQGFVPYSWETGESGARVTSDDQLLKAYLQYFINGLIHNNLSIYR